MANIDFWELYETHFSRIYSYARCRLGSDADAEDISSAVFHKALAKLDQFDQRRGNVSQWLFGIARNEVNYHFRMSLLRKVVPLELLENVVPSGELNAGGPESVKEMGTELDAALQRLEKREVDLVSLKFYSGLNNREISEVTGISESNVGTILWRAMVKLRETLGGGHHGK